MLHIVPAPRHAAAVVVPMTMRHVLLLSRLLLLRGSQQSPAAVCCAGAPALCRLLLASRHMQRLGLVVVRAVDEDRCVGSRHRQSSR